MADDRSLRSGPRATFRRAIDDTVERLTRR
jgi:hypothetical protein